MAKQRRAPSRAVRTRSAEKSVSASARGSNQNHAQPPAPPAAPAPRPGHAEAVALYEEGVAAMQGHDYARASALLRSVVSRYPEERELHERVRLYLNVCERHMAPRAASPTTPEERVFAATLAVNAGNYDEALEHLRVASVDAPEHDHALYMLASVLALRDQLDEAATHLVRAIELNADNRSMARHDPDLEILLQFDNVRAALEAVPTAKGERRKGARRR
jgi:tetratricopeptide (TPR) repeat protein